MELRPYQRESVEAIEGEWGAGRSRTLLVLPTGCGKTIVMAEVARRECERGGRTLLLAHRGELLQQAADKIGSYAGLLCGVEKAQEQAGFLEPVVVGSVQSMCRDSRLARYAPGDFSLVMVDEAHHSVSRSYRDVLDHFGARVLGVTATPDRADRRGLAGVYDSIAYEYNMASAVRDGFLSPITCMQLPVEIDMRDVRTVSGDYAAGDVGDAIEPMFERIVEAMVGAGCRQRRTVVFLPLVATAKKFAEACRAAGFRAAEVDGASEDRAEVLADYAAGKYDVLCNAMLLTEGWDCPAVDCVVPLRATKSRSLFQQMVGRGSRLSPETGKTDLLLLDFLWQTSEHSLCRPASLLGADPDVAEAMDRTLAGGGQMDLFEAEERAEADVVAAREAALASTLREQRARKARVVDPLQYALSIGAAALADYSPSFGWESGPVSEKQRKALEKAGIDVEAVWCAGLASELLDRLRLRRDMGLATPRQIRLLEARGFAHVGQWGFDDAQRMIGRIAENRWRTPADVDPATYRPGGEETRWAEATTAW